MFDVPSKQPSIRKPPFYFYKISQGRRSPTNLWLPIREGEVRKDSSRRSLLVGTWEGCLVLRVMSELQRGLGRQSGWVMEFWPEFVASSWGREFFAGGVGGMAGVVAGHPLDTLKTRLQQPCNNNMTAVGLLRKMIATEGPSSLVRGMGTPLATVAFQNAVVFQVFALFSRAFEPKENNGPPSYRSVALAGVGTGALQSFMLTPVELLKVRLQLSHQSNHQGPMAMARQIIRREGFRGMFRGMGITMLRDMPGHGTYFWTYEYTREVLHPGCRKSGEESLSTMLVAGGWAGVASWLCCYPLDVVKSRLQAQTQPSTSSSLPKYSGIVDCFRKSLREEGYQVLWKGLGTTVARAFVVNGAIFAAYETALRLLGNTQEGEAREHLDEKLEANAS